MPQSSAKEQGIGCKELLCRWYKSFNSNLTKKGEFKKRIRKNSLLFKRGWYIKS